MKILTLTIDDSVSDKFMWLLQHFSSNEVRILSTETMLSDDDYLRSIDGMVKSIQQAKAEPLSKGVSLQQLDW
jgi:hypothetical protein